MLRKIRIVLAVVFFMSITLLFLDFTGSLHSWLGWMAKIQFLPALLSLNLLIVFGLIVLTLIFGRIYCSVICPLGVFQDIMARLGRIGKKNRYSYSSAMNALRYTMLIILFIAWIAGISALVELFAPYSAFGRMANNLLQPLWIWINNGLALLAEKYGSYMFYRVDIWIRSISVLVVSIITFIIITILAWRNGRTYCNTICPVGTILGFFSRYSWFKPIIDKSKCVDCGLCARRCKAACIDPKHHSIDYSRCVDCMDCLEVCKQKAIIYTHISYDTTDSSYNISNHSSAIVDKDTNGSKNSVSDREKESANHQIDNSKRKFISIASLLSATVALNGKGKLVDGGLAIIKKKQIPTRHTPITPAGSLSARNMSMKCTGCQLCVSVCPNDVLRPSGKILNLMQPVMSFERGYCRPECTRCSDVCPTGAIKPITKSEKSSIQIGHAVWIRKNCVTLTDGVECGNCARHCPTGAIQMVPSNLKKPDSPMIPVINTERCIGCGACENLCPARPFSAIYVEGHENHRTI